MGTRRIRAWVCLGLGLLVAAGGRGEEPSRHAVVIGVSDYADPAIPDLKFAESDAKSVYAVLTDPEIGRFPKDNVRLLLGRQVTPSNVKAALWALRGVGKDDLVVVFYSGHGAKEGDEAFWVTHNAQATALPATALSNAEIRKYLGGIPSRRLVTLLDCCYAASTVKKSLADPSGLFGQFRGKGRVTIAGSADNQEALEYEDKKAGVFTYFLVRGLSGQADANADGAVTFEELWSYLGANVRKVSVAQGGLHEPVIITEEGLTPRFLLTLNPSARAANLESVGVLRDLLERGKISGAQYDEGRRALTEPAVTPTARALREVFVDLVAGRLSAKYLRAALVEARSEAEAPAPETATEKPTLAVVPFDVLGKVSVPDAGRILAERLLPMFAQRYRLVDQTQLKHFLDQDDLTAAGVAEMARAPRTRSRSKAVRMRAVRFLVVGTVAGLPDGTLSVTARITDWQSGGVGCVGQVRAEDWTRLEGRLAALATALGVEGDTAPSARDDARHRSLLQEAGRIRDELRREVERMAP